MPQPVSRCKGSVRYSLPFPNPGLEHCFFPNQGVPSPPPVRLQSAPPDPRGRSEATAQSGDLREVRPAMRLGSRQPDPSPIPSGPIPKEPPPPPQWSLFSKRQPQLLSTAWDHCPGGKALLARPPPSAGLETPGGAPAPPSSPHLPLSTPQPRAPTAQLASPLCKCHRTQLA